MVPPRTSLGFFFAPALLLLLSSPACSSKISCADLGDDWTTCPAPRSDICVLKSKASACDTVNGTSSSSSSASSSGSSGADSGTTKCTSSFETSCSGKCVLLDSDERNCGACGRTCDPGLVCFSGSCQ